MLAAIVGFDQTYEEEMLLEILREKAKVNCNKCSGRGQTGYIDEMLPRKHKKGQDKISLKAKFYIPCHKCFTEKEPAANIRL